MVFYNLFIFLNNEAAVKDIRWLVIKLLEDEQLEASDTCSEMPGFTQLLSCPVFCGKATGSKLAQQVFLT